MFSYVLLSHSLSLDMLNNFCFHLYAQKSLSHSHTLISLSHLTLSSHSFTHSWHAEQLLFSCLCWNVTLSISHSLTLTLSHSLTLSLSHSPTHPLIQSPSTCWTTFVFIFLLKSHFLTLTLSHSHTLTFSHSHILTFSHSHSHTLSIFQSFTLSFTHSWHSEQLLF